MFDFNSLRLNTVEDSYDFQCYFMYKVLVFNVVEVKLLGLSLMNSRLNFHS